MSIKFSLAKAKINAYRAAHLQLHSGAWHEGIPDAHTQLIDTLKAELLAIGYASIEAFFNENEELNIQEIRHEDCATMVETYQNAKAIKDIEVLNKVKEDWAKINALWS